MLRPGQIVPLAIEKPAAGGRMIARANGQVVLVAGAIPGEHVRARVERIGKGVAFADSVEIDDASPDRREPFADPLCGGCVWGHIAYARQLAIKSQVIADAFARIGHVQLPSAVHVAPSPEEGYRMRARLHVRGTRLGFFREGTHDICDVRPTRQLLPSTCDALDRLQARIRSLGMTDLREIELSENIDASERVVNIDAATAIDDRLVQKLSAVDGLTEGPYVADVLTIDGSRLNLRRHVRAFFQGNRYLLTGLVSHVVERRSVRRSSTCTPGPDCSQWAQASCAARGSSRWKAIGLPPTICMRTARRPARTSRPSAEPSKAWRPVTREMSRATPAGR